ncbi:MAG: MFS transporter [Alphaproteobacteria bacterium]
MSDTRLDDPAEFWRMRLTIVTTAHAIGTLNSVSVLSLAPVIRPELGLSFSQFGLLISAYSAGQITGTMPAGILVDKIGVGWALVLAHMLLALATATLTQANGLYTALAAMLFMGWAYAIVNPATARGVLEWFPPRRRATAMGVKQAGVPAGGILAAGTLFLTAWLSWQGILWVIVGLTCLGGLICLPLVEAKRARIGPLESPFAGILRVARDRNYGALVGSCAFMNAGQHIFFTYLTLFMREALQSSQGVASIAMGLAQGGSAIGRIGWGVVSDTVFRGRRKKLTAMLCIAAVVFFGLMAAVDTWWGIGAGLAVAVLLGLTIASWASLIQTLAVESVNRADSGSAIGFLSLGTGMGSMVGPPLFGAVIDATASFSQGWLVAALVTGVGVVMFCAFYRER